MDTSFPWGRSAQRTCFDCLDDRSRFAFAKLYERCDQDSAISFLCYVIARAPFVIRAIRTDCGREWSTRFSVACALAGIRHIRNEPYHPEHNGKIEKFHDGLKYRCFYVYLHPADCIERQNADLRQWLTWYNYYKVHLGMGMNKKTPAEVVFESLVEQTSCVRLMLQPNILQQTYFGQTPSVVFNRAKEWFADMIIMIAAGSEVPDEFPRIAPLVDKEEFDTHGTTREELTRLAREIRDMTRRLRPPLSERHEELIDMMERIVRRPGSGDPSREEVDSILDSFTEMFGGSGNDDKYGLGLNQKWDSGNDDE